MNVIYVALPVALLLGGLGLVACIYCITSGQYDDIESSSIRILVKERRKDISNDSKQLLSRKNKANDASKLTESAAKNEPANSPT